MDQPRFRIATPDDAEAIAAFVRGQAEAHFLDLGSDEGEIENWLGMSATPDHWLGLITEENVRAAVVDGADGIEASACMAITGSIGHLGSIYVAQQAQGRGRGAKLMQVLLEWAAGAGAELIELETAQTNEPMRTLAERLGFSLARTYEDTIITNVPFCVYTRSM